MLNYKMRGKMKTSWSDLILLSHQFKEDIKVWTSPDFFWGKNPDIKDRHSGEL